MARSDRVRRAQGLAPAIAYARRNLPVLVRAAEPNLSVLLSLIMRRYPEHEWASFVRFGWRETPQGLVLTLASVDAPGPDDMDESIGCVGLLEPYTLRTALAAEQHGLAVGVVHSHPQGCRTSPSPIDDDMDGYFSRYFSGFAPGRPYVSLIFARDEAGNISGSGRVFWHGQWHTVSRFLLESRHVTLKGYQTTPSSRPLEARAMVARLESAFGTEAADRLERSTIAVIGAGGTGSPVIEALARAGVGHLIVIDPDCFDASNHERVHGSEPGDITRKTPKVEIARRHIRRIKPSCRVTAIQGALPQPEAVDAAIWADVIIGCTDQEHSRVALNDLSIRYLVPALDCGVGMEGENGQVTGQIIQLVRLLPSDPCVYCRKMITQKIVNQELMTEDDRQRRQAAADAAEARGEPADPYWHKQRQINTVGYLTTAAGGMVAGFAIGMITGRFAPHFSRLQMDLSALYFNVTDDPVKARPHCLCRSAHGMADQADPFITPPSHWPSVIIHAGNVRGKNASIRG